jgi:hypothetical protein
MDNFVECITATLHLITILKIKYIILFHTITHKINNVVIYV